MGRASDDVQSGRILQPSKRQQQVHSVFLVGIAARLVVLACFFSSKCLIAVLFTAVVTRMTKLVEIKAYPFIVCLTGKMKDRWQRGERSNGLTLLKESEQILPHRSTLPFAQSILRPKISRTESLRCLGLPGSYRLFSNVMILASWPFHQFIQRRK